MTTTGQPRILIVDDAETSSHTVALEPKAEVRARHPKEVSLDDLNWAHLVLMDFIIDDWPERDELSALSCQPKNGIALASVLREHVDSADVSGSFSPAFAVHSAHIEQISPRLQRANRVIPFIVARLNNLEWAFDKADERRIWQAPELANAVMQISTTFSSERTSQRNLLPSALLEIPTGVPWASAAMDDIVTCQAPISDMNKGASPLEILRWMLHSIIPFPTFLIAKHWVAARLRITVESLSQVLESESPLSKRLDACVFTGILSSFDGVRWWRMAIEQLIWEIRSSADSGSSRFHERLEELAENDLTQLGTSPTVCVGKELTPEGELTSLENVARILPDVWPTFAEPAYALISVIRDSADLELVVDPLDRERVGSESEGS